MADSGGKLFIYSIIGFFVGLWLFYKGFGWLKLKRLIENMPTSKVRSIAMGLVELYGEVVPYNNKLLKSPLLNKDCVYYSFLIQERRGSGKNARWVTLKKGADLINFYLKDNTGKVLVDPKFSKIDLKADLNVTSRMGKQPPAVVINSLKRMNLSNKGFLGINKTMKYQEFALEPKNMVYVLGTAGDNPFVEDATGQKNEEDIMIQRGKHKKLYYISDRSEKDLIKHYTSYTLFGLIGGAVLSVGCLAVILGMLGLF